MKIKIKLAIDRIKEKRLHIHYIKESERQRSIFYMISSDYSPSASGKIEWWTICFSHNSNEKE